MYDPGRMTVHQPYCADNKEGFSWMAMLYFNRFTRSYIPYNPIKSQSQLSTQSFVLDLSCKLTSCIFTSPALSKPLHCTVCRYAPIDLYSMISSVLPQCSDKTGWIVLKHRVRVQHTAEMLATLTKRMRPSRETVGRITEPPTNDFQSCKSICHFIFSFQAGY